MHIFSKRFLAKALFAFILVFSTLLPIRSAQADIWGASIASSLLKQALETIMSQLQGAMLGTLKVAANEMLNSKIGQMVGGSSAGSAMIVSDWNQFLYEAPKEKAQVYMNDFFSTVTRGQYASANYVGVGDTPGDVNGSYVNNLVVGAQAAIRKIDNDIEKDSHMSYDLSDYVDGPADIFGKGDWRGWNAFISNPMNNPIGFGIETEIAYAQQLEKEQTQAKIEVTSPGFIAPKVDGKTVAPVATIEKMVTNAQNIGNEMVAAATNPGEFLAGVVGAMVNKTITNLVQRGVGKVQANIKREIGNFDKKVSSQLNKLDKQLGPAAKYLEKNSQRVNTQIKPYTSPPPAAGYYCVPNANGDC